VLLLQIPLALALGFGSGSSELRPNGLLILCFAALFILGASLCFKVGNWALDTFERLRQHRELVTLAVWLLTGFVCVAISVIAHFSASHIVHVEVHSGPLPLKTRLVFIPLMWIASLLSTSHVFQSRHDYIVKFRELQQTNFLLTQTETSSQEALAAERQKLATVVRDSIKPELKSIASEIRDMRTHAPDTQLRNMLNQIDGYSLQTVRALIADLNQTVEINSATDQASAAAPAPRLSVRNLPLDPMRSLRITAGVGAALLLPLVGFHTIALWLLQVLVVFSPLFALNVLRLQVRARRVRLPEGLWTILGCFGVVAMRLYGVPALAQVQAVTAQRFLPLISGGLFGFSVILGSLDKYFIEAYADASGEQERANVQLVTRVNRLNAEQQIIRRDLSRLLHGPIQGRLAAVRMKLHLLTETAPSGIASFSQENIDQLALMVDQIVHDIETLTEPLAPKIAADVAQEIDAIVANWKGMMHVEVELSPRTSLMLDQDSLLARKVIAACSEAITNASRHGQATRVAVALHVVDEETALRITVQDNGRGALAVIKPGIGLQDITADGGQWKFIASSSGTTFQVDFAITPPTV